MQIIFFTKFLKGRSVEETGEIARRLGFDGLDLAVRAGHCINPENAKINLPQAVSAWREMGLSVPLVTLEGTWTDPQHSGLQSVYRACSAAGVPLIKLGYWFWKPEEHYWDQIERYRRDLQTFQKMGEKLGICTLIHTHSDALYGSNASGAMHLARGFDPRYIAIYLDPAHLAWDGEYLPMALDIARDYLRVIGVKNALYEKSIVDGRAKWEKVLPPLEEGLVDWREAIGLLKKARYDGPLSYHGEVDGYMSAEKIEDAAARDMTYLRACLQ